MNVFWVKVVSRSWCFFPFPVITSLWFELTFTPLATTTFLAIFKTPEPGKAVHQGLNALARYMSDTKKLEVLDPGNCLVQEPTFIPRTQDAPEGDGWLIVMIDNLDAHRNDLVRTNQHPSFHENKYKRVIKHQAVFSTLSLHEPLSLGRFTF